MYEQFFVDKANFHERCGREKVSYIMYSLANEDVFANRGSYTTKSVEWMISR